MKSPPKHDALREALKESREMIDEALDKETRLSGKKFTYAERLKRHFQVKQIVKLRNKAK